MAGSGIKVRIVTRSCATEADAGLLDGLTAIASRAAAAILSVGDPGGTQRAKPDRSPVTAADEAAEAAVLDGLARLMPGVPVVSEESGQSTPGALGDAFLLVDPLDGTRELLAGEREYTVNIALVRDGVPVLGVIAAPAMGLVWRGGAGRGAERLALAPGGLPAEARERTAIAVRARPARDPIAAVSRFHRDPDTERHLDRCFPGARRMVIGSAVKFCRLAEGAIDIYARLTQLSEWDIAAGHALVAAAGGTMTAVDGAALRYGNPGFRTRGFVACGAPSSP